MVSSNHVSFSDTNYFSSLICDYLSENKELRSFYNRFPTLENFKDQIEEKAQGFSEQNRKVLVDALENQYQGFDISDETQNNIELLKNTTTYTVTTGHQLNLFTGPLYFLYKIISTINLTVTLNKKYPTYNFVPIYWMATEDHDFEEINYFNFLGKKIQWNASSRGAVGEIHTQGLEKIYKIFSSEVGLGHNAEELKRLFKKAYLDHNNLADATRHLVNQLFKSLGLVILDGNDKKLKGLFASHITHELVGKSAFKQVSGTVERLQAIKDKSYKIQVNPREINLFYMKEGLRARIIESEGNYYVHETDIMWSKEGILKEVTDYPERFSPNVLMRPLYQESVLPNLCYIGGGGELAYWIQLKSYFENEGIPFPMLLLRSSVLIESNKQSKKLEKLNISDIELFLKQHELINKKVREISNIDIDFSQQRNALQEQFKAMYAIARQTDITFLNAVKAQEAKQLKGIDVLENRLLKAQKRKLVDHVSRLTKIQDELFPSGSLQERNKNFSEFYLQYGEELISVLCNHLKPLESEFLILKM